MFSVYVLLLSNGKHYTGLTNDIDRRLSEHQAGRSISTRWGRPVTLVHLQMRETRIEARKLEVKIKKMGAKRYLLKNRFSPGAV